MKRAGRVVLAFVCCLATADVFADYIEGYEWNWKADFVANGALAVPVNPSVDSEGSADVWGYVYNTNGAASATDRNVGSMNMALTTDNALSLIWSVGAQKIIATYATDYYALAPAATLSGKAQLSQLVWTAPIDTTIRIHGTVLHPSATGNGTAWYLDVGQSGSYIELDSGAVYNSSEVVDLTVTVVAGDQVVFSVDALGGNAGDATRFDVVYGIVPEPATGGLVIFSAGLLMVLRRSFIA